MDTKRGFTFLLAVMLISCLNACAAGPESLGSSDFNKSVQSAIAIFRRSNTVVVSKSQTADYVSLLHSENKFVAEAAAVAIGRAGESALEALTASVISGEPMKASFESGVESVVAMTNILLRDFESAMLLCYAAESLSETGSQLTVKYLQIANSIADGMTNETDKAVVRATVLADKYRFGVNGGLENLTNFVKSIETISSEYRKAEAIRAIAGELKGMDNADVSRIRNMLAETASRLWEQKYRARAMSALAVSAAGVSPESASRWAYSIYNGYNKEDYSLVLDAAEAFAAENETARALEFYRIAVQMAESLRDSAAADYALTEIAHSWAGHLPDQAWEIVERLAGKGAIRNELLSRLSIDYADKDFKKALYIATLLISEADRASVLADLAERVMREPSIANDEDKKALDGWVTLLSNRSQFDAREALIATEMTPTNGMRYLENASWNFTDRFKILTAYASGMSAIDEKESLNTWNGALTLLQGPMSENDKLELMTFACDAVLKMRFVNPYPIVERLRMIASSVTNTDTQAAIKYMIAGKIWDYDRVNAKDIAGKLERPDRFGMLTNWIGRELQKYRNPPEYELLKKFTGAAVSILVDSIVSNRAGGIMAIKALNSIISGSDQTVSGSFDGFAALAADTNIGSDSRFELVKCLEYSSDPAAQEAIYAILTDTSDNALRVRTLEYIERNGMNASSLADRLAAVLTNRGATSDDKRTAVVLLGYAGSPVAVEALNRIVKQNDSPAQSRAAFYALLNAGEKIPQEVAMRFAQDNMTASVALDYLAKNQFIDALKNLYSNAYYNTTLRDRIAMALSVYSPESRKYCRLGYTGYFNEYMLYCFQMKGYECVPLSDIEDAQTLGCSLVLDGSYEVTFGTEEITYIDRYAPDGASTIRSEEHRATIRLKKSDGSIIWSVNAYGMGAAWAEELFAITDNVDLQGVVANEARKALEYELYKRMQSSRDSIPFNY